MDVEKLETLKHAAATFIEKFPGKLVFSAEQVLELLDEIERLDNIIYQGSHMQFKDQ